MSTMNRSRSATLPPLALDLGPKKDDDERAGVREYLVFGLEPRAVHRFVRRGERLTMLATDDDGLSRSEAFPGRWLDPPALEAGDRNRLRAAVDRRLATPEHAAFAARLAEAARREEGPDRPC